MTSRINAYPPATAFGDRRDTILAAEDPGHGEKTADEFAPPKAQGDAPPHGPRALGAEYDVDSGSAPRGGQREKTASGSDLEAVGLDASGIRRHCRAVGADRCTALLSKGILGSHHWMATRRGARGSHARSPAKPAAPRENGKRVGRDTPIGA